MIDDSQEHDLRWVVFIDETGECWTFENPDVRLTHNLTFGRLKRPPVKWRSFWKGSQ